MSQKIINPLPVAFYNIDDAEKYGVKEAIVKQYIEQRANKAVWEEEEGVLYLPDLIGSFLGLTTDQVRKAVNHLVRRGVVEKVKDYDGTLILHPVGEESDDE